MSRVFDPEANDGTAGQDAAADNEGDGNYSESGSEGHSDTSSHGSEQSTSADADTGVGIDVTIPLHLETGVEYQTEDGSGGWSNTTDATLTVSTSAILGAAADASYGEDSATY
ncbi:hypothetical protein BXU08_12790 [Sphingomonas sp. LM7]|nr:hypothetical protein BXU08_12790 [Sphingomonas sp. LM7]